MKKLLLAVLLACSGALPAWPQSAERLDYGAPSVQEETGHVFKTASGLLYDFQVNTTGSGGWIFLIDGPSIPSNGAALTSCGASPPNQSGCVVKWYQVNSNSTLAVSWGNTPLVLINGITLAFSTTGPFTNTASSSALFSAETQ